ncbi:MAG: phosphotransferase [Pirellulaceae bacterium]|jgi:5-methylthioribose kinase|nr:phosphotransferase [Pirellulaceae bacterium]
MFILEVDTVGQYLVDQEVIASVSDVQVRQLLGGVSNRVLLVEFSDDKEPWVLKQAREQLAVEQPWFCSVTRVLREMDVLQISNRMLADKAHALTCHSVVPEILFEDRENYVYAMTAMQGNAREWKQDLLAGELDAEIFKSVGWLLGTLHSGSWEDSEIAEQVGDQEFFEELRIDPYYRQIARVHPALRPAVDGLVADLASHRHCLVHGDFSPKNMLLDDTEVTRLMLLDYEVGHYGDPAFDLGFFLTHLVIKSIRQSSLAGQYAEMVQLFIEEYQRVLLPRVGAAAVAEIERRSCTNLGACLVARVDGKSPVEYLLDPEHQETVRQLGKRLLLEGVQRVENVWDPEIV